MRAYYLVRVAGWDGTVTLEKGRVQDGMGRMGWMPSCGGDACVGDMERRTAACRKGKRSK